MPYSDYNVLEHQDPDEAYCSVDYVSAAGGMPDDIPAIIGRFLFTCASLEGVIVSQVRAETGMPDRLARIVVGAPKLHAAVALRVKVAIASDASADRVEDLKAWKKRVEYVFRVRNVVAHQEPAWRPGWLRYHNYPMATQIDPPERLIYVCRTDELLNLTTYARMLTSTDPTQLEDFFNSHQFPPDPQA
ncbi:hypothetical protein [Sphingomonas sp. PP-CC-3A-396]|uniref:hypothetical protein n=1 Tax=Sphingomonas sp. PP-CC-3A-396 TaxID=2135655 RepID=UPI00105175B1|nr:hypothetical protein [Sphingomonas sp. PP-CC-3A-396]